ncbi:MAG: hypothetical protein KKD90_01360 [Candidatus Omnitrophica bacterium]|nr:hypothetical protein [Candidatus Omnitrophota bacterium]MBU4148982.1 hypothetical protein [Candidatus Omnitrophota bacterium]
MSENKKKNIELNIAIGLAVLLLIAVVVIFTKNTSREERTSAEKEIQAPAQKKEPTAFKPQFSEFESDRSWEEPISEISENISDHKEDLEQEEEMPEIMSLQDLPLDSIQPGEKIPQKQGSQETLEPSFSTQPSVEDVKKLQQKGLIIY